MTLDKLNIIDKETKVESLISRYKAILSILNEEYKNRGIYRLVYSYKIIPSHLVYPPKPAVQNDNPSSQPISDKLFNTLSLPENNHYLTWSKDVSLQNALPIIHNTLLQKNDFNTFYIDDSAKIIELLILFKILKIISIFLKKI